MSLTLLLLNPDMPYLCKQCTIMKTCLYNFDPLKPHFYIVKLGFAGVCYFSYFCSKHRLWVLVRVPTIYVLSRNMKNITVSYRSENFKFLEKKFSIYLNRCVFVMSDPDQLASEESNWSAFWRSQLILCRSISVQTNLGLHCLSSRKWICINNLDQVIWLAKN